MVQKSLKGLNNNEIRNNEHNPMSNYRLKHDDIWIDKITGAAELFPK